MATRREVVKLFEKYLPTYKVRRESVKTLRKILQDRTGLSEDIVWGRKTNVYDLISLSSDIFTNILAYVDPKILPSSTPPEVWYLKLLIFFKTTKFPRRSPKVNFRYLNRYIEVSPLGPQLFCDLGTHLTPESFEPYLPYCEWALKSLSGSLDLRKYLKEAIEHENPSFFALLLKYYDQSDGLDGVLRAIYLHIHTEPPTQEEFLPIKSHSSLEILDLYAKYLYDHRKTPDIRVVVGSHIIGVQDLLDKSEFPYPMARQLNSDLWELSVG